ncbi:antirestriction protein ArdA [Amycolatopsis sp. H20-H5]|uniref:antirestriction protein ArdA n=1 Tax=Amycolatopsis sp. H20-H5 TaxID=3046309 RepID=UPI002DBA9F05|nr:antirestriction protein ArdA [Amycolatopsis sp. H20-H5]MEC3979532.1 antirestriction protein ArdA [Amycolatopsis sp. H20-H5]
MEQHPRQPNGGEHHVEMNHEHASDQPERSSRRHPRVYVADLVSLERGIRHGLWIDALQDTDELDADITAMLDSSPTVGAAQWAIHGAEDFAGINLSTLTDTTLISRLARGVADYGEAFAVYVDWIGTDEEMLSRFGHHYRGTYSSPEAWGRAAITDLGWQQQIDERLDDDLLAYVRIDYTAWASDESNGFYVVHGDDGIHVFGV